MVGRRFCELPATRATLEHISTTGCAPTCPVDDSNNITSFAKRLAHATKLPFCRCLQRMRKLETAEDRKAFLTKAKRRYAALDRDDEEAVEDLEFELGI